MDHEPPDPLGDDLAKLLRLMTLSDGQLAREIGVSSATVRSWRTGRRKPSPRNSRLLAASARNHARTLLALTRDLGEEASPPASPPVAPPASPPASPPEVTADLGELRRHTDRNGDRLASLREELEETTRLLRRES
jgi:transcriptional regulator with XRE-family HTH domain